MDVTEISRADEPGTRSSRLPVSDPSRERARTMHTTSRSESGRVTLKVMDNVLSSTRSNVRGVA